MTGTSNVGGSVLSQKNKDLQQDLPSKPQDSRSTCIKQTISRSPQQRSPPECGPIQKMVDIAKSRGYTMEKLLAYDITGNSPLFGDDGFMQ